MTAVIADGKRGAKRKREVVVKEEDVAAKLRGKLHHAVKEIKKTGKKVKAFETQRVVKKLKDARKKDDNESIAILEAQLEHMKHISTDRIGIQALRSKINKDASLSRDSIYQEAVSSELLLPPESVREEHAQHAVIVSRLLSSKILAQEVSNIVHGLRSVIGAQDVRKAMDAMGDVDDSENDPALASKSRKAVKGKGERLNRGDEEEEDDWENEVDETERGIEWTGFESENSDADEDRDEDGVALEASEGEVDDGGWESGTVDGRSNGGDLPSDTEDASWGTEASSTGSAAPPKKARIAQKVDVQKKAKAGESTFLPSLSVGFVRGDSDSEWSDAEADIADMPQRKNRRGQRARKAIWEKKYGKNANHIKKQRETEVASAVAAAYGARGARGRGGGRGRGFGRGGGQTRPGPGQPSHRSASELSRGEFSHAKARPAESVNTAQSTIHGEHYGDKRPGASYQKSRDDKPLHPSWEAKRRLKEKQSPAILPAQGTRIKFD